MCETNFFWGDLKWQLSLFPAVADSDDVSIGKIIETWNWFWKKSWSGTCVNMYSKVSKITFVNDCNQLILVMPETFSETL